MTATATQRQGCRTGRASMAPGRSVVLTGCPCWGDLETESAMDQGFTGNAVTAPSALFHFSRTFL